MNTYDVRINGVDSIESIRFADNGYNVIIQEDNGRIALSDEYSDCYVAIQPEDIPNLIKALQKAVELGWTPKPKTPAKHKIVVAKKPVAKAVVKK